LAYQSRIVQSALDITREKREKGRDSDTRGGPANEVGGGGTRRSGERHKPAETCGTESSRPGIAREMLG